MRRLIFICITVILFGALATAQEAKLFSQLPPSSTGVTFSNDIVDLKESNILLYSNYYGGAGVAIADFDNDGLQDLYFAGNLVDDKIYKNLGGLKFEDFSLTAGLENNGAWSSSVIVGDVNNDGLQDIYVTCELYDDKPELRKNKLYINKGNFHFVNEAEKYGLDNSERTRGATFIDYDKDGRLDLFLLNQPPNPGNYSPYSGQDLLKYEWGSRLYRNEGNGRFTDVSLGAGVARPSYPNACVVADIDGDGWQDLYVSNDYEAPDFCYINNQDGTFTNVIDDAFRHISYYAMGVDAADINNDGRLDLMTLDMVAEDNFRQKRNMSGMNPKLFWKLVSQGAHYQYMFNALHLNQGNTTFSDIAQMAGVPSTDWSWSNVIADFDNDGWKDIYITNGLLRDIRNTDMVQKFTDYVTSSIESYLVAHPNSGEVDIFDVIDLEEGLGLHPSVPLKNYGYRNKGDLTFEKMTEQWGLDQETFSNGCAYADLDNDGDLELVANNINSEALIYENRSNEISKNNFLRIELVAPARLSCLGTTAKVFAKGKMQFAEMTSARGMYSMSESLFHFGLAKNEKVDSLIITWPDGATQMLTDIPANQKLSIKRSPILVKSELIIKANEGVKLEELAVKDFGLDYTHTENDFDDYSRQVLLPHELSHMGPASAVGDVNGDGLDDLFLGGAKGQSSALYLQSAEGRFVNSKQAWLVDSLYEDVSAAFLDSDGDGDLDLYVVSGGNAHAPRNKHYLDRFYLNDGTGQFNRDETVVPRILESGSCVVPFDMDMDGDLDLFVGGRHQPWDYPTPTISRLLENQKGSFVDVTKMKGQALINIGMVSSVVAEDYNMDGQVDLVVVGEWMPITFLKNTAEGFVVDDLLITLNNEEVKTDGWWQTIKSMDLDGDGDQDYIIGNLGTNYKYKASQDEPFTVHYYDFDASGQKDIVLSYYNFGEQYPLRGRACSSEQIPDLKKEFPSYDLFASMNLEQVYDPTDLEQALHYDAHMFESIFLINEGGKYKVEYLPNEAQVSNVNSILSVDLDNDAQDEIILAGNMYQSEVETPRNDASVGLVLKKNGNSWEAIPTTDCDLYLPYDVRVLHSIRIGDEDYTLVVSNDDQLRLVKAL